MPRKENSGRGRRDRRKTRRFRKQRILCHYALWRSATLEASPTRPCQAGSPWGLTTDELGSTQMNPDSSRGNRILKDVRPVRKEIHVPLRHCGFARDLFAQQERSRAETQCRRGNGRLRDGPRPELMCRTRPRDVWTTDLASIRGAGHGWAGRLWHLAPEQPPSRFVGRRFECIRGCRSAPGRKFPSLTHRALRTSMWQPGGSFRSGRVGRQSLLAHLPGNR